MVKRKPKYRWKERDLHFYRLQIMRDWSEMLKKQTMRKSVFDLINEANVEHEKSVIAPDDSRH